MLLCSIFENKVPVYEDNQGVITLVGFPQIQYRTDHITINYHHFRSFSANGDVEIKHVDTKEQIADIFTKSLYSELFGYLCYKLNCW